MSSPHPSHLPPRPVIPVTKKKKAEKGVHTPKGSVESFEEGWSLTFPRDGRRGSGGGGEGLGSSSEKEKEKEKGGKGKKTAEDVSAFPDSPFFPSFLLSFLLQALISCPTIIPSTMRGEG
jgi:hypothetical protein